jgi:hypothetical protein
MRLFLEVDDLRRRTTDDELKKDVRILQHERAVGASLDACP